MRFILFCQNNYAFGILGPIMEVLKEQGHDYLWFVRRKIVKDFPFRQENHTSSIIDLEAYLSDVIFVPGNEVPYYLRGLKVQIFHGLAGEKKGHFRMRSYFDLYLTQGPYFTERFNQLRDRYNNFDVIETGWPKLDIYGKNRDAYASYKNELLNKHSAKKILLYAPTFSPKLTSGPHLSDELKKLANNSDHLILIKFHPLMEKKWVLAYQELAAETRNIIYQAENNIIKFLLVADLLISDTSSVIYEFLLLDKPAITFKSIATNIRWENSDDYTALSALVERNLKEDPFADSRAEIYQRYHPYNDGRSALRMVKTVEEYVTAKGIPERRDISLLRKIKINSMFGRATGVGITTGKMLQDAFPVRKLTVLIITYNEEDNIRRCLDSISFADEVVVVDSYSEDKTIEIIGNYPDVTLVKRTFTNFTDQKNAAIKHATNNWILFLDADEVITPALKEEILELLKSKSIPHAAYWFYRKFMFKDKRLRFSGWQTDKNIRLFRKDKCEFTEGRLVHETLEVNGSEGTFKSKLVHYSYKNYEDYRGKMLKYGQLRAQEEYRKGNKNNTISKVIKTGWKFFNHYILRLGILDGKKGVIICYLNALSVYERHRHLEKLWRENA